MAVEEELDCVVIFTREEMEIFNEEIYLELSNDELKARMGEELPGVQVLYDIDENPPPGISGEHYYEYGVYADLKNPTALIIDGEHEENYFRIRRPKDYSSIEDTLQGILQDRIDIKQSQDDWAEHDRNTQFND